MAVTLRNTIHTSLPRRLAAASFWIVAVLAVMTFLGEQAEQVLGISTNARSILQALLTSALVVPGIWWLWTRVNHGTASELGLEVSRKTVGAFITGIAIVAVPVVLIVGAGIGLDWARISIDSSASGIRAFLIGVGSIFFLEALPEEVAVRGYIYRNLSGRYSRLKASAIAVGFFVMLPVVVVFTQKYLLGLEVSINGQPTIQPGFLVTLFVFGSFVQYLRVVSGSIWVGIGFHTAFVLINRIIGPREDQLIRFDEILAPGPLKFLAIGSVAAAVLVVFAWPWWAKRSLGWREVEADKPYGG